MVCRHLIAPHCHGWRPCLGRGLAASDPNRDGPPAIIKVSSRVVACDCDAGIVKLESGVELQGDLVVGADGIHSTTRQYVLGEKITPKPTGLSAYRLMVPSSTLEENAAEFCRNIKPREPFTSMIMAHSCRLIMGPAREGEDPLFRPQRTPDEAKIVPAELFQEILESSRFFSPAERRVHQQMFSLHDLSDDRTLNWHLRIRLPHFSHIMRQIHCGDCSILAMGDAAHGLPIVGSQGAEYALKDAKSLAEAINDLRDRKAVAKIWPERTYRLWYRAAERALQVLRQKHGQIELTEEQVADIIGGRHDIPTQDMYVSTDDSELDADQGDIPGRKAFKEML